MTPRRSEGMAASTRAVTSAEGMRGVAAAELETKAVETVTGVSP